MTDLQTLADRIAIDDLLTSYTVAIDTHDWDRLDTVFTPDAHIDYTASRRARSGAFAEVKAWLSRDPADVHRDAALRHARRTSRLDGDEAAVRAYFLNPLVIDREDGSRWHMDIGGIYAHTLVRTPDGWRSRRLVEEMVWNRQEG